MAKSTLGTDKFCQVVGAVVDFTPGSPPSKKQIVFGLSILDKVGIVIHRVDYSIYWLPTLPVAPAGWEFLFGISASPISTSADALDSNNPAWISREIISENIDNGGVAVAESRHWIPQIDVDYSLMPGGGLITPPSTVFLQSYGTVAAMSAITISTRARIYYTIMDLTTEDYWQLVESRRMIPQ